MSKKCEELAMIPDFEDNILSFSFDKQYEINREYQNDELTTYLNCKNLQDIYEKLYTSHTLDVDIEKREIYGQLEQYKFTFDMLRRELKTIANRWAGTTLSGIPVEGFISPKTTVYPIIANYNGGIKK